jgi:hypothetical protein
MGPIDCPETSVRNYHYTLRKIPEERRYHLRRDGGLKSRIEKYYFEILQTTAKIHVVKLETSRYEFSAR